MEVPETDVSPDDRLTLWEFYRQEELKKKEEQKPKAEVSHEPSD